MEKDLPLRIDPEFRALVAPVWEIERIKREIRIERLGEAASVRVWNDTVLVDYDTYSFCCTRNWPMRRSAIRLDSREEAIIWICRDQLKRADLTVEMTKYLIGKQYLMEKQRRRAEKSAIRKNGCPIESLTENTALQTAERIGMEYHISVETVRKYGRYAYRIDQLTALEPKFVQRILQGTIYLSYENVVVIAAMNRAEIAAIARYFLDENETKPTFLKYRKKRDEKKEKRRNKVVPAGSIKEMPAFDPDAVVASLALTIPSWVSSIQRTEKNTEFSLISGQARSQLLCELARLADAIEDLLAILEEEAHG